MTYTTAAPEEEEVENRREFVSPRDLNKDRAALQGDALDVLVHHHLVTLFGAESFDETTQTFMNGFQVVDLHTDNGGILIRPQGVVDYGLEVTGDTVNVAGLTDEERLTDQGLEATLDAALMAANLPNAEAGIYVYDNNPEVALTMMLAARDAGLTVMNDDAIMNELTPELAARIPEYEQRLDQAMERITSGERLGDDVPDTPAVDEDTPEAPQYETAESILTAIAPVPSDPDPMQRHVFDAIMVTGAEANETFTEEITDLFNYEDDPSQEVLRTDGRLLQFAAFGNEYDEVHGVTATPEALEAAAEVLAERGIEDPDGTIAEGLAQYATRVAEIANEATGATPPEPDVVPDAEAPTISEADRSMAEYNMGVVPPVDPVTNDEASVATVGSVTDLDADGEFTFNDFVAQNNLQYAGLSEEVMAQYPAAVNDGMTAARIAMNNVDRLNPDSVAINNTVGAAVVALAEQDPDDPTRGSITYTVVHNTRSVYVFTEDVRVNPDGTVTSEMEEGERFDMTTASDREAYGRLLERFGDAESPDTSLVERFERQSGRDLAVGGVETTAGEVEIRQLDGDRIAAASASDMSERLGVEIESSYNAAGEAEFRLTRFMDLGDVVTQATSTAPGLDDPQKYETFMARPQGIMTVN